MNMEQVRQAYASVAELYIGLFGTSQQVHADDLAFIGRHLMWNGVVKCEDGIAVVCLSCGWGWPARLGAGQSPPCLDRCLNRGRVGRVRGRRSRSRSDAVGALDAVARQRMIEQRREGSDRFGRVGNGVGGHDASGRSGSVRRPSDVRVSRSHVGYAQDGAPD